MPTIPFRWLMPAALLAAISAAMAQSPGTTGKADPLDAQASVPRLVHESPLTQYRKHSDEKLVSWREANDTVGRIGGWRTYLREARQPDPAPAPSTVTPVTPAAPAAPAAMPAGHGGHKMN